ncbi:unnamed protein product [Boreogadus saida]
MNESNFIVDDFVELNVASTKTPTLSGPSDELESIQDAVGHLSEEIEIRQAKQTKKPGRLISVSSGPTHLENDLSCLVLGGVIILCDVALC